MFLLIFATILSFMGVHASLLSKLLLKLFNRLSFEDQQLVSEQNALKDELKTLSISRDFVKYSKNQRKIIKINEKLKENREKKSVENYHLNMALNYGPQVLISLLILFTTVYYRHVPVFIVDLKYNLFPFEGLIAFPNKVVNAVSVHFWMVCCASVAKLTAKN